MAGARRGRHPALHGVLPDRRPAARSAPSAARACTSSPGRPSGARCTCTPAARRRRRRSSRRRRAAAPTSTTPTSSAGAAAGYLWRIHTRSAPHNVYTDGKHLRRLAKRVGAEPGRRPEAGLEVRRPAPARAAAGAAGSSSRTSPTRSATSTTATATPTGARSRARRSRPTRAPRPGSRRPTWSSWRSASRRSTTAATRAASRPRSRAPARPGSRPTARRSAGTWKKPEFSGKTRFFDKNGNPVTLTRGQTFVQVVPLSANDHRHDGKAPRRRRPSARRAGGPIGAVGRFIS